MWASSYLSQILKNIIMRTINKKMRTQLIIFSIGVFLLMNSCSEEFLYKEPKGVVSTESLNTADGVNLLLMGTYSLLDGAGKWW